MGKWARGKTEPTAKLTLLSGSIASGESRTRLGWLPSALQHSILLILNPTLPSGPQDSPGQPPEASKRRSGRIDEPGPGGVRVGATRTDLDCRVVATSRRVAPTECDSRLPLFGRGSTCRLRLLDSWPPRAEAVWYSTRRAARLVCRDLSPRQSPTRQTNVARGLWPNSSDSSDSSDEDVTTRRDSSD